MSARCRELEKEVRILQQYCEQNKALELENFELNDKVEIVRDRMKQMDTDNKTFDQMISKLETTHEKEEFSKLVSGIKRLTRQNTSNIERGVKELHAENEYSAAVKVAANKKAVTTSDIIQEIVKTQMQELTQPQSQFAKEDERKELAAAKAPHYASSAAHRPYKEKKLRAKMNNEVVNQLRAIAQQEKRKVEPLPKKMLLRTITAYYGEGLAGRVGGQDLTAYVYADLLNRYGLKNVADRKFLQVLDWFAIEVDHKRLSEACEWLRTHPALWSVPRSQRPCGVR